MRIIALSFVLALVSACAISTASPSSSAATAFNGATGYVTGNGASRVLDAVNVTIPAGGLTVLVKGFANVNNFGSTNATLGIGHGGTSYDSQVAACIGTNGGSGICQVSFVHTYPAGSQTIQLLWSADNSFQLDQSTLEVTSAQ